jgi:light-regulated signal transduction histidine kinase (bacteriophytochrome)
LEKDGNLDYRDDKQPQARAIMQSSIGRISHDLANSINQISNTVQLLEQDLKNNPEHSLDLIGKVITTLKNQCSQMQIQLEELRRLSDQPLPKRLGANRKKAPREGPS